MGMGNLSLASTLFLLLCGHALADFALQNEWVATNKNRNVRNNLPPNIRASTQIIWPYLLSAHSLHHGLMVFLITGRLSLACAETGVHWLTDFGKCEHWFGFHADQMIHIGCKFVWLALIAYQVV